MTDEAAGVWIPDETVDRIYHAAHILPASEGAAHHAVWHRKMFIGCALQRCYSLRADGLSRDEAREAFDLGSYEGDERYAAEMARMRDLILEIYGRV